MTAKCLRCGKQMNIRETEWIAEGRFYHGIPVCHECKKTIERKSIRNGASSMGRC